MKVPFPVNVPLLVFDLRGDQIAGIPTGTAVM